MLSFIEAYHNIKYTKVLIHEDDRYWDIYERTGHQAYDDYIANEAGGFEPKA